MDTIRQDVRYALQQFVRRPAFTAIAVLSLAIGIGGNSLVYGIVDAYVLHPFPYPDPDRFVCVGVTFPKLSSETRYVVSTRTQEMGVRLAMGTQRGELMWLIVRQVLTLAAAGLAIGVVILVAASSALRGLLYGIGPSDPVTIVAVAATLGLVALGAAWPPARRASRVDPIEALRYE